MTSYITSPETHESVVPVDHESRNVSALISPTDILLPENKIGNYDICEQPDEIEEAKCLVVEEDCVTELLLESPKVLEDSGAAE